MRTGVAVIESRETKGLLRVVAFAMCAVLTVLASRPAQGRCSVDPCLASDPNLDCDQDGYTNQEECAGLDTAAGFFPSCRAAGATRPACMDPVLPDLFVLLQKGTPSVYDQLGIPAGEEFQYITQPPSLGGLGAQVHVLDAARVTLPATPQPNSITSRQAAVLVREQLTPPATACPVTGEIGRVNMPTSSNNSAVALIYSQRILDQIDCVYDSVDPAIPATSRLADKRAMLLHTSAHEATHYARLAPDVVERFGGQHYKTSTGCVLDQSTAYSTKGGKVSIKIATTYCGPDQAAVTDGFTALGALFCADPDDIGDQDGFSFPASAGFGCLPVGP